MHHAEAQTRTLAHSFWCKERVRDSRQRPLRNTTTIVADDNDEVCTRLDCILFCDRLVELLDVSLNSNAVTFVAGILGIVDDVDECTLKLNSIGQSHHIDLIDVDQEIDTLRGP